MKTRKMILSLSLSVLIISTSIGISSFNGVNTIALVEEKFNLYNIDSFNRTNWKWSTTTVISTESTEESVIPSLAVDSSENIHIAWLDNTNYTNCGTDYDIFYKRWNSSSGWTTIEVVSTESTQDTLGLFSAVDGFGNAHIVWYDKTDLDSSGIDYDIFYKRWNASSSLWSTTRVVSTESTSNSFDPCLAVDSVGMSS